MTWVQPEMKPQIMSFRFWFMVGLGVVILLIYLRIFNGVRLDLWIFILLGVFLFFANEI